MVAVPIGWLLWELQKPQVLQKFSKMENGGLWKWNTLETFIPQASCLPWMKVCLLNGSFTQRYMNIHIAIVYIHFRPGYCFQVITQQDQMSTSYKNIHSIVQSCFHTFHMFKFLSFLSLSHLFSLIMCLYDMSVCLCICILQYMCGGQDQFLQAFSLLLC